MDLYNLFAVVALTIFIIVAIFHIWKSKRLTKLLKIGVSLILVFGFSTITYFVFLRNSLDLNKEVDPLLIEEAANSANEAMYADGKESSSINYDKLNLISTSNSNKLENHICRKIKWRELNISIKRHKTQELNLQRMLIVICILMVISLEG
jgi:hypothetical protein